MQYQIPFPHAVIKQAPSTAPPKSPDFNEPVFMNEDWTTAWLNRNVLYYPTITNKSPNPKYIEPTILFDPTGWMDRNVLKRIPPTIPTLVPFLASRIDFDPTIWLNRNTLYYPTITNPAPPVRFVDPNVMFDLTAWLDRQALKIPLPTKPSFPFYLQPVIAFDATTWINRGALYLPTTTNAAPPPSFLLPTITFDSQQWMARTVYPVFPTGIVPTVVTPILLFDIDHKRFYIQTSQPKVGAPYIRPM